MAGKTPLTSMTGHLSVLVLIEGSEIKKTYYLKTIETVYEINKVPYARVVIQDGDPQKQKFEGADETTFMPGSAIEIKAGYGAGNEKTIFKGIIIEEGITLSQYDGSYLTLICRDKAHKMTVGRKNKIFYDKPDSDIIKAIVGEAGLSADVEATTGTHKKLIQYHCTDWDFVLSRADSNSLVTLVKDGKLTIKKPDFSKKTDLVISYGKDMLEMDLTMDSTYQLKEVQANFWDHAKQAIENAKGTKPSANAQGDKDTGALSKAIEPKDLVQTPAPVTKDVLKAHAEGLYQHGVLSRIRGRVSFLGNPDAEIGKTIELFGISKRFLGDGYISKVRQVIDRLEWVTEVELGLPGKLYLDENRNAFALPAGGLLPPVHGLQIGVVKQIHEDPDGEFRVLVNIPIIDLKEGKGVWARMSHYYATKDAGYVFYPEVEDEVLLGFLDNDPTYPIILGSLYSSKRPLASIHTPDNKNTFKAISTTQGKMRIEFEDVKKIITIITPKKHVIMLDDDKDTITIEDPINKNKMVMDSKGILLQAEKDITLKSNANIIMEAMKDIKMKATANIKAEATANYEMKATAQMKAEGTAGLELKSAAMSKLEGAAMTEVKGGIVKIN
jgi:Rhs element Vgr protein